MKIVFISNFINHHQAPVADVLYSTPGVEYWFVETMKLPEEQRLLGYADLSDKPYVVKAYESEEKKQYAKLLSDNADVVIIGAAPDYFIKERIKLNKLRMWLGFYLNHFRYRNRQLYMLAASAYTAADVYHMHCYNNKVYKWGYFTKPNIYHCDNKKKDISSSTRTSFMWCARFLWWKHPELPVLLAYRLKKRGYSFIIDMYGMGEELEKTKDLIEKLNVGDRVRLCGSLPNEDIIKEMNNHDIFLFTSDRNEGWGAVLNESMSCGCAVVASHLIGSVPFLIKDGENGLIFESNNIDSLEQKVRLLLDKTQYVKKLSANAIKTIDEVWSPANAAKQLLILIEAIQNNRLSNIPTMGPCSKAEVL